MVTTTETTKIITQAKNVEIVQPSIKRWLKHLFYMPSSQRFFSKQDQHAIAQAVAEAEHGHIGEIQVVIEGHLPLHQAYRQNSYARALQLFAELAVWDTQYNSGVLLYLNLCEHRVEIIIDRGIKQASDQNTWQQICQNMLQQLAQQHYKQAVISGVREIGEVLNGFYAQKTIDEQNELCNQPILLR